MKPSLALALNREAIRRIVESHRARNARVFGSVVHGDDTENSDLDILIDPTRKQHVRHWGNQARITSTARRSGGRGDTECSAGEVPGEGVS